MWKAGQGTRWRQRFQQQEEPVRGHVVWPCPVLLLSLRSTGPTAGAGQWVQQIAAGSFPENLRGQRNRKAGSAGAEGRGPVEAAWLASHGSAVLNATLGRDAGPRQEAAEQAVGLAVEPLWDRARAQAG